MCILVLGHHAVGLVGYFADRIKPGRVVDLKHRWKKTLTPRIKNVKKRVFLFKKTLQNVE